jgi:hypothetical protein
VKTEELHISIGCFGFRSDDFVSCAGVENRILLLNESLYNYEELMNYLDICRLFDKPMFDYNSIRHFIFNMQDKFDQPMKRLWSEKKFELLQKFTIDHRRCGLYIKLILIDPQIVLNSEEPKRILIPAIKPSENSAPSPNLKLIRGRL